MFKSMLTRRNAMLGAAALVAAVTVAQPAAAITPDEIKARGKIIVGIQGDNPPWGFVTSGGKQDGLDADIATLFAKELGVSVEFVPLEVNNRIPALTAGRVDVLFATMAMLPDRAKAVQFSKPYVANAIVLIGPKSAEIKTNADMAKFSVGVAKGAAQDTQVTKNAPEGTTIRRYDGDAASVQALVSGQVDTLGGNIFYMDRVNKARPGEFENKLEFQKLYNGACTRLGEKEINAALNTFIDKIKTNGDLKAVYDKWMKVPVPEFPEKLEGIPFAAN
ncbi:transporter substrate-binding domain-containing protein [Rhizobium sp. RMa-01]|uniref:transporter substrate-binding domain-containing protein n=1 Tax=unclassified Rhizobium TaxID=2613769 RepID=UPI0008DA3B09|nr:MULTISPECIES: transporter substrate-binding domain-containing protein [unclassified Rhizobium]OHV24256.1 ABC transporter substrate-binding protein [Rhizobium sp. RSm-3]RVU07470.1 transporter substrate-binding domain-containing protein [Rhizobium sp. RMa-01]WHO76186.1 transporter substrate-binding domain-containing protein [Rhizobium sp. BT03]